MVDESDKLLKIIPIEQIEKVFSQPYCDIEPCFIGFTDIYESLSKLIPKHFTVIDLGCAYNPQCFYFLDHREYIAVDVSDCIKFRSDNCRIFEMDIERFITMHLQEFDLNETFAICSYIPPWHGHDIMKVAGRFKNIFTFYPHGSPSPFVKSN